VDRRDFFISHADCDDPWAQWIGQQLVDAGYRVELDVWDWAAGMNFVEAMSRALSSADRVLAVYTDASPKTCARSGIWPVPELCSRTRSAADAVCWATITQTRRKPSGSSRPSPTPRSTISDEALPHAPEDHNHRAAAVPGRPGDPRPDQQHRRVPMPHRFWGRVGL
jgi:hypothetical protein